jgi:hypothetical protein
MTVLHVKSIRNTADKETVGFGTAVVHVN